MLLYYAADELACVNPDKIQEILGVPFQNKEIITTNQPVTTPSTSKSSQAQGMYLHGMFYNHDQPKAIILMWSTQFLKMICVFAVNWDELLTLAERLRPHTKRAMKIEVAPWIKDYVTNMEDLYTELILEKIDDKPTGECVKILNHYKDVLIGDLHLAATPENLFSQENSTKMKIHSGVNTDFVKNIQTQTEGKKILFKGNPGMGKTTLVKKITWDWADRFFRIFAIVFFVFLKLVNPGDTIENIIIDQNPVLEGLGITSEKLRVILDTFGNRCLLVLDGLDEHALGTNKDVLKIIQGQKLLDCNVIVSSRPHTIRNIQSCFQTIVRIDGFTLKKAKAFSSKLLTDHRKIQDVLKFNPADFRKDIPIYKCPILLSFMCLLVREDDIDLSSETIDTGEIYTRMVRCLYKKFTIRKDIEYEHASLLKTITNIGKLAFETLLSGNPLLRRSQVTKDVGPDAFDYGLLIGHEDFRLIRDETADIFVTFPHRSIQEFLGAFYFILMLNAGENIKSLLGPDCKEPIFMMNPLFFHFCLWFLCSDQKYFTFENRNQVTQSLIHYCREHVGLSVLQDTVVKSFLAIEVAMRKNDTLSSKFLQEVLPSVNALIVKSIKSLEWILPVVNPEMTNVSAPGLRISHINDRNIAMNTGHVPDHILSELCQVFTQGGRVHLQAQAHQYFDKPQCIFITSLNIVSSSRSRDLGFQYTRQDSLFLTHLSFVNQIIKKSTLQDISSAVSKNLTHLSLVDCDGLCGNLSLLFESTWPKLSHLNMFGTELDVTDLITLFEEGGFLPHKKSLMLSTNETCDNPSSMDFLFKGPCINLTSLFLDLSYGSAHGIVDGINTGLIPNLYSLGISMGKLNLELDHLKKLHSLTLHHCIIKCIRVKLLGKHLQLQFLDISGMPDITGNLAILLCHSFPSLNSLILKDCGLNSQDLCSLAQTSVEGRLPQLTHLDISYNRGICFNDLFKVSYTWNKLLKLNIIRIRYNRLNEATPPGSLNSLQEISICDDQIQIFYCRWQNLQRICLFNVGLLDKMAIAVNEGRFPALRTVCVQSCDHYNFESNFYESPAAHKLLEKNISVHAAFLQYHDPFSPANCLCQLDE